MSERRSFTERVSMQTVYDGLASNGIELTEEERQRLARIVENRTRGYEGSDLVGDNLGLSANKLLYFVLYMIQNIGGNTGSFSMDNFGSWVSERFGESTSGTEFAMLQQCTRAIHADMMAAGGNLARAAVVTTGQADVGAGQTVNGFTNWSVYGQIRTDIDVTPDQVARGDSLNGAGQRFNVANATETAPPGATPAVPATSTLTVPPRQG